MSKIVFSSFFILCAAPVYSEAIYASRVIRPGEIINSSDLRLGEKASAESSLLLSEIVGAEARVIIYADRPIRADHTRPPTLVSRNQLVSLIFEGSGLRIEAEGRAMERGSLGESIKVMNLGSRRTVTGTVLADRNILVGALR